MAAHIAVAEPTIREIETRDEPGFAVALLPIILVIGLNYVFTTWLIPSLDTEFLAQPKYGATKLSAVAGLWSIILAVFVASVAVVALNWRRFANLTDSVNKGTLGAMLPMFNTASEVGYGAVI